MWPSGTDGTPLATRSMLFLSGRSTGSGNALNIDVVGRQHAKGRVHVACSLEASPAHPEQVVRNLAEGERNLTGGDDLAAVLRIWEISEAVWNRWRSQYGGMKGTEAKHHQDVEVGGTD